MKVSITTSAAMGAAVRHCKTALAVAATGFVWAACSAPAVAADAPSKGLHLFRGGSDGSTPITALFRDKDGNLYGGTEGGGTAACDKGCGVIYMLAPKGKNFDYQVIYKFPGTGTGTGRSLPNELFRGGDGFLYGSTYQGGDGYGTVFRLKPPSIAGAQWDYEELHRFANTGNDGVNPEGPLVAVSGDLYGVTQNGGDLGLGTFFKVTRGGVKTTLYSFAGSTTDADAPSAVISDSAGGFFGVSDRGGAKGCGTVFHLTPRSDGVHWRNEVLYSFVGSPGWGPCASAGLLLKNGILYGTTYSNNQQASPAGNAYTLTKNGKTWIHSVIFTFHNQSTGANPVGALVMDAEGVLYGMTYLVGSQDGAGTAYKLTKASPGQEWTFTRLLTFYGDGSFFTVGANPDVTPHSAPYGAGAPVAGFVIDPAGKLYGTTTQGGVSCPNVPDYYTCGTVLMVEP